MNISEYIDQADIRQDFNERYHRTSQWANYEYNSRLEIQDYLDEKGVDFAWGVHSNMGHRGRQTILHFYEVRSKFYKEVIKPGILEISKKWRIQTAFRKHRKRGEVKRSHTITFRWLPTEIDAGVLK
jgi:hypothetical protein